MKTLEFTFQDNLIHFLINPLDNNVLVNATEMAKPFNRKTELFLKSDHAKAFIEVANRQPNGGRIIDNRGRNGVYFNKRLALKFAAWLSPEFEYWIYSTIDEIVFGNYRRHWEAHAQQEVAKSAMQDLKHQILENPTPQSVAEYFRHEQEYKDAKNAKSNAIRTQLKLFGSGS